MSDETREWQRAASNDLERQIDRSALEFTGYSRDERYELFKLASANQHPISYRSGYNAAIDEMIVIHKSVIALAVARRDEALEDVDVDLVVAMQCTVTNEQESINKLEKLKKV